MDNLISIIDRLSKRMTQTQIAEELRALDVEVTQATISRIWRGEIKNPGFEIGLGLMKLAKRTVHNS